MHRFKDFLTLCKLKVISLMLVTTWVGMYMAGRREVPWPLFCAATLGVAALGSSAAIANQIVDRHIDAKMLRTASRPLVCGRITSNQALQYALALGLIGTLTLYLYVNTLTTILTLLALLGYALLYTVFLKRASPQNIVIGGIAGAMPPLLGWASVTNSIDPHALLLVLIIFTWTPPHFWALAIYREAEYRSANIPMLPVTHGIPFTKRSIVLYTFLLFAVTLLPYVIGMNGTLYLLIAITLGLTFVIQALRLYWSPLKRTALSLFSFSIVYLFLLFMGLLLDYTIGSG